MKIVGVIFILIALAIGFVMVYAVIGGSGRTSVSESEEAFIASVLEEAAKNPSGSAAQAMLPPDGPGEFDLPIIEVETNDYDIGLIDNDNYARGEVWVYNRGTAPLKISRITTSCNCTEGQMANDVIAPGGKSIMRVTVNPLRIHNRFESHKILTIHSNDPNNTTIQVAVSASVDPEFTIDPPSFDFGIVPKGKGAQKTIVIRQAKTDSFEIVGSRIVALDNVFDYRVEERPAAEWRSPGIREYLVTAVVLDSARMGSHVNQLEITTNLKRVEKYNIAIRAQVEGAYELDPMFVTLRSVEPGQTLETVLTITGKVPVKVTAIDASNDVLKVIHRAGDAPNTIVFDIVIGDAPGQPLLKDRWKITIEADGVEYTEEVSVLAILKNKSVAGKSTAGAASAPDSGGGAD